MNRPAVRPLLFALAACGHAPAPPAASPHVAVERPSPRNLAAVSLMVKGAQAAKDGQRDSALGLLRQAVSIDGGFWEARYDLGIASASAGDLAGAEEQLTAATRLAPDGEEGAVALAEVRRRRGELKLAADGLAAFVRERPLARSARTLYVAVLRESGQVDRAIGEATEVLARTPGDANVLAELSLAHLAKGEKEAAALLAKQAVDASPNSAVAHRATGLLDLANGDDAGAFAEFRKAAQADPHDTTSRINMGVVLLRAGAYAKAEEQYGEILRVSPDDDDAAVGLAAALHGESDAAHPQKLDQAKALLEKVLTSDSHDTVALFNMGVLLADGLKRPADAAPFFKRFLGEAPSDHPLRAEAETYVSLAASSAAQASAPPAPPSPARATAAPPHPTGVQAPK